MNGWLDGWTDGDGTDRWINQLTDGMDGMGQLMECMDGRMEGWTGTGGMDQWIHV